MPGFLAGTSILMWFILMLFMYSSLPNGLFVPFFVVATMGYMKMMAPKSS